MVSTTATIAIVGTEGSFGIGVINFINISK